jgi:outer membrane protein assembly factor BamB
MVLLLAGAAGQAAEADEASKLLGSAGVSGGLVVQVGCGDSDLLCDLGREESYVVHGLDREEATITAARASIRRRSLHGRVSCQKWSGPRLPYAPDLVNVLVVAQPGQQVPQAEAMRVLAPRGVLLVRDSEADDEPAGWTMTRKAWPDEIDEWTHFLHGADGNAVARDRRVGPPRRLQWTSEPLWSRNHHWVPDITAMVSARGRLFYICDESKTVIEGLPHRTRLIARDAFSGVRLWQRDIDQWGAGAWSVGEIGGNAGRYNLPIHISRRLVAEGDRVYVTLGYNAKVSALDAATGKTVREYDGTEYTDEILYVDGVLVLAMGDAAHQPGTIADKPPAKKTVVALDPRSGRRLWEAGDFDGVSTIAGPLERITHLGLAARGGRVVFLTEKEIVCLDLSNGRELWRQDRDTTPVDPGHLKHVPENLCTLVVTDDVVLYAQPKLAYTRKTWNSPMPTRLVAFADDDGRKLWEQPCGKWGPGGKPDVFVVDDLVYVHDATKMDVLGLDVRSGELKRRFSSEAALDEGHHHRCFRNKATERFLLTGRRGIEFIGLQSESIDVHHWVRGVCRYGIMPGNGLIYVPPHSCNCYIDYKINGFNALAPAIQAEPPVGPGEVIKGPAMGYVKPAAAAADDWPTLRGNTRRGGGTAATIGDKLRTVWSTPAGNKLTACTVAAGKVFLAIEDEHSVAALSAADGQKLWTFTADGVVDSPPTYYSGHVLFGAHDGHVYACRASDGALAWKRRIAPGRRKIVSYGQVASAWPVHGAVLVADGVAYAAAGRSTFLDGGIHVCALDPLTGELLREETLDTVQTGRRPPSKAGLADVLASNGKAIFMRHLSFAPVGQQGKTPGGAGGLSRVVSTSTLLDSNWFSRVGWDVVGGSMGTQDVAVFNERFLCGLRSGRKNKKGHYGVIPGRGDYLLSGRSRTEKDSKGWSRRVPVRAIAMLLADDRLFLAGPPDVRDPDDPWAAIDGRAGGLLQVLSARDGSDLAQYPLEAPPVFDGMSAASGRLYISLASGRVVCMGSGRRQD